MSSKPIIFVLGLSGVGKTDTSNALRKKYSLRHIDMDKSGCFTRVGLPGEWDNDCALVDFAILADRIRSCLSKRHQGAILSFPTTYRFTREQLDFASGVGISTVVLWGEFELCMESRRKRQESRRKTRFSERRYRRKNAPTFDQYLQAGYEDFRVEAFETDRSRRSYEAVLLDVVARIADKGTQLIASA